MDHLLLLLLLRSSGPQAEGNHMSTESDEIRLVEGDGHCAGRLELKHEGDWRPVEGLEWTLREAAVVCRELDCGSAVSIRWRGESSDRQRWKIRPDCVRSGSSWRECVESRHGYYTLNLTCSDSVRLLNGTGLCSGRLEVRSNQRWSSMCIDDFDRQDAEVVCRELGCGAPSVLQGALYGEVSSPVWSTEFQCGGHESALLDCRSDSARITCSTGKAVGLTCSEPDEIRLVEGDSHCVGRLELKHEGDWRPVDASKLTLQEASVLCRKLDCGSAVSIGHTQSVLGRPMWWMVSDCVHSGYVLRECVSTFMFSSTIMGLKCSDFVRLLNGTGLCSGRLEVRSNQRWSSVCEDDFDHQDAEVVCRELDCGAPSALQGALYGEVEVPVWYTEFQCGGHESALLDCRRSDSATTTCSTGKAVGLTCSEPDEIRLVGGESRCAGRLEMKLGNWRPVDGRYWDVNDAAVVCRELDCGSAVSIKWGYEYYSDRPVWWISSACAQSGSVLRDCLTPSTSRSFIQNLICSDFVRLLNGTDLCSGRLEVKSSQGWSSVCEDDFDLQDAEVVCRELGCGAPSALQRALYGEVEVPVWSTEFQCGGNESALLDCRSSNSTCSSGKAVGLTCSEPVRLVGGGSRCAGTLEVKHEGDWRPVGGYNWTLREAAVVCRKLHCGSAISIELREGRKMRVVPSDCVQYGSPLRECLRSYRYDTMNLNLNCSDPLLQPIISVSSMDGVSQARQQGSQVFRGFSFTISCSIQPQYPGGSFLLTFTTSSSSNAQHNYTQPAVNHSTHFLFPVAEPAHQGNYTCVYQVYVFSHNFSSESRQLSVSVSDPPEFPFRVVILPLTLLLLSTVLYFYCKATRGQTSSRQEDTELVNYPLGVGAAEEEGDVQGVHPTPRGI